MHSLLLTYLLFAPSPAGAADGDRVLFISMGGFFTVDERAAFDQLVAAGADAELLMRATSDVTPAERLAQDSFDQIWISDISTEPDAYDLDWLAIDDWYNPDSHHIIADARFISSFWQGQDETEGADLAQNYFETLRNAGGGIVIGTDGWFFTRFGTNDLAAVLGIGAFDSEYEGDFVLQPSSPILMRPNVITSLSNSSSTGAVPVGLQANGQTLVAVGASTEAPNEPGISTTIGAWNPVAVDIVAPVQGDTFCADEQVQFDAAVTGGSTAVTVLWQSDDNTDLATDVSFVLTAGVDVADGEHTITVSATDAPDPVATASITFTVGGPDCVDVDTDTEIDTEADSDAETDSDADDTSGCSTVGRTTSGHGLGVMLMVLAGVRRRRRTSVRVN